MLYYADNLSQLVIPASIKSIESSALVGVYHSCHVFYEGTAEDWEKIEIAKNNSDYIKNKYFVFYYYSETEPTDTENTYWFKSANGVVPLIWGDKDNDMKNYILSKASTLSGYDIQIQLSNENNVAFYLSFRLSAGKDYTGRIVLTAENQKISSTRLTMEVYMDYIRPYFNYYSYGEWKANANVPLIDGSTFTLDTDITYEDTKPIIESYLGDFTNMLRQSLIELNDYLETNDTPITFERFGLTAIKFN